MSKETGQSEVQEKIVPGAESSLEEIESNNNLADGEAEPISLNHEVHHEEELNLDFTGFGKEELVAFLKDQAKDINLHKIDGILREIKPLYDGIHEQEKKQALEKFISEGGSETDFDFRLDELDIAFDANYKLLKDKKNKFFKEQEAKKSDNLQSKQEVLEKLRAFVDAEETNISFDTFKKLQEEWKSIGNVPAAQAKTLWANYKALVDRFYDNRSIYFELKELDRKKNLESKLELCVKAEKLADVDVIKTAVRELNELHNEFKHIGPVPADEQEAVWQRFKAASDAVYARRDAFVGELQKDLKENLVKKQNLCEQIEQFASFQSDRIKLWNQKTKEVLQLQKQWEAIGAVPRAKAKEINKQFWSSFKGFFNNKSNFFKKLDQERDANLKLKQELVEKAKELKESEDWEKTANQLKNLQTQWKEVGPVPEKVREKIYAEFKAACDHFFNQRRTKLDEKDKVFKENLSHKQAIITELKSLAESKSGTPEKFKELAKAFEAEGFVPRKAINSIREQYNEACNLYLASVEALSVEEKGMLLAEVQLMGLKNDPNADKKIYHKEQVIRKKISKVENDIAVWKNNLEFFGRSKNAEKFKEEFNGKIEEASAELNQLKQQLKILRSAS